MDEAIQLAGCVLLDDYGRLLLLHRYQGSGQWEMPGGKVEEDESPAAAAAREAYEELGIRVQLVRPLGSDSYEKAGETYVFNWFLVKVAAGEPQVMETDTFDDLDYFDFDDLPSLSLSSNMLVFEHKVVNGEVVLDNG